MNKYQIGDKVKLVGPAQRRFDHNYGVVIAISTNKTTECDCIIGMLNINTVVPSTVNMSHREIRQAIGTNDKFKIITKKALSHKITTLIPTQFGYMVSLSWKEIVLKQLFYV